MCLFLFVCGKSYTGLGLFVLERNQEEIQLSVCLWITDKKGLGRCISCADTHTEANNAAAMGPLGM